MNEKKFDPKKLQKLNNPKRLKDIPTNYVRSRLKLDPSEVMVEIGAGTAFFSIAFLEELNPSMLYACDLSEAMITYMRDNVSPRYPNIIPLKNDEHSVPLEDGIADLVFMIALHHELEDASRMLLESYRILKPGGDVFIVDWKKEEMPEGPPMAIRCVPEQVRDQLVASGFHGVYMDNELPKHFLVAAKKPMTLS